jgi:hypothetical protein
MSTKRKRKKRSGVGRLFEVLADVTLFCVVLAFGISIAARYGPQEERLQPVKGISRTQAKETVRADRKPGAYQPTVDIRNGCGRGGLAEEMMSRLRRAGFDVVEYRDADNYDYAHTLVKDRAGKPEGAGQVCAWLQREFGVGETVRDQVPTPSADVLLILGADLADSLAARGARTQGR